MRYLLLAIVFALSACASGIPKFPDKPNVGACPEYLETVEDGVKLSELLQTIKDNYITYHTCDAKVKAWDEWYDRQRKAWDEAIKKAK